MRRRRVAIGIICTLVAGLLGPAAQPALAAARCATVLNGIRVTWLRT